MTDYPVEFLDSLEHHTLPYSELIDIVISRDVREVDDGIANIWLEMVEQWRADGLTEEQCVDLFHYVVLRQYSHVQNEQLVCEIYECLGSCCG